MGKQPIGAKSIENIWNQYTQLKHLPLYNLDLFYK